MTHILHLDASPRGVRSISRTLSAEFIANWKAAHPNDTVTYRDIGHYPVPFVSEDWIAGAFTPPEQQTLEQTKAIRVSDELIDEFLAADRYVFGIPMYNFSIPANFKAYIDQVVRVGRTFLADETGYKALVHDRKMTIILAQGGTYPEDSPTHAYDLQTPYLRFIFGFIGITDVEFIYANGLNLGTEARNLTIVKAQAALKATIAR
ncbi:FMN-dependent NADH-azoreductase [Leptolyngbya sp. FACHB-711]|uniref:FMN-dependent NADH-azoreductase n=1 Tax=unclassified Leptolyngbya TaxID=2650499 RepID=UPI001685E511|nr:FMN-dependent NADH-azoreductase [Leptolyngbya sp. FACHB-711]MBD1852299.1 FMN-dependent NADH-azoreductase [Cyanobacteria bacterium FACHB-502]MBD2023846.1 FMN-dependent NADH-azoreductase [Leptolyngbya sp. FACHB-711]